MRNSDRQYIPVMSAKPVLSIWQRARRVASTAVFAVRSAGARVIAFVARKATGARAAVSRVARAAMIRRPWIMTRDGAVHAAQTVHAGNRVAAARVTNWFKFQKKYAPRKVSSWAKNTWSRVVRPFMRVRVVALGIGAVVIGLVAAPIATLTITIATGAALLGLSRLIAALEVSSRPSAHTALVVIEYAAQAFRLVAYAIAGAAVIAISAVSIPFALTEVAELVMRYLDVPHATSLAALAFFVMTANWGLGVVEVAWLALVHDNARKSKSTKSSAGERQAIPLIRTDAERAWNGVEVVNLVPSSAVALASEEETMNATAPASSTTPCMGCDLDDRSPRFRVGSMSSLCGDCFKCLVDDELITAADRGEVSAEDVLAATRAGIQVPAYVVIATGARLRSTRIDLDREAVTCRTEARVASEQDSSKIHWAETGWWFDARGSRRARRWHGFVSGLVVAVIEYEYRKDIRGFYVSIENDVLHKAYKTLAGAQDAAADEIGDRAYADTFTTVPPARTQVAGVAS